MLINLRRAVFVFCKLPIAVTKHSTSWPAAVTANSNCIMFTTLSLTFPSLSRWSFLCLVHFSLDHLLLLHHVSIPQPLNKLEYEASSADVATGTFSVQNPGV
ncbi:unnamed protein product [Clavelina lepadiformis]|uniref:Uncharacterized protein n=1 Tax=Clavelina lepadiformis TaxID=159417 RepID=A0ABP0GXZ8_CLALP